MAGNRRVLKETETAENVEKTSMALIGKNSALGAMKGYEDEEDLDKANGHNIKMEVHGRPTGVLETISGFICVNYNI